MRLVLGSLLLAPLAACGSSAPPAGAGSSGTPSSSGTTPAPAALTAATAPWTLRAPTSRTVALSTGRQIVVLGGLTTGDVSTSAVTEIDPSTGAVAGLGRLTAAVHDAAGAFVGGKAYVFGGGAASTISTVQVWDPAAGGTAVAAGHLPQPRSDLAAVQVGGTTYVVGGFDGSALPGSILATSDGTTFRVVGALLQPVRYPAVMADSQGRVWVVGGDLGTSESAAAGGRTDDIQRFDPATGSTSLVGHLPTALGHAAAFGLGGSLFVAGGRSGTSATAAIWRIDSRTGAVSPAGSLPGARSDAGVAVVGSTVYLLGGELTGPTDPLSSVVEVRAGR